MHIEGDNGRAPDLEELNGLVDGIHPQLLGHVGKEPSLDGGILNEAPELDPVGSAPPGQVLHHLLSDPCQNFGIVQTSTKGIPAAHLGPARKECSGETRGRSRVGVLVRVELDPLRPGPLDAVYNRLRETPNSGPQNLGVGHDPGNSRFPGHGDYLLHRGDDTHCVVSFVPDVALIGGSVLRRHLCQLHMLPGIGVAPGRVEGAGGKTPGPLLHPGPEELLHFFQILIRGKAILHPDDGLPEGSMPHHLPHVYAQAVPEESLTLGRQVQGAPAIGIGQDHGLALGQERSSVAQLRRGKPAPSVRVGIDEARSHEEPRGVYIHRSRGVGKIPNGRDPVTPEGHVGQEPGVSGAVENLPVADDYVIALLPTKREGGEEKEN